MEDLEGSPEIESTPDVSPDVDPAAASEVESYEPNYGFRVKDDEHEFDEWIRPAIQSKEHEEKLRELYTKAYGLDGVKSRLEENERRYNDVNGRFTDVNTRYEQMQTGLQKLGELRESDFSTFRKVWQIADHRILEEASRIMKYMNDPNLRQEYDQATNQRIQMLQQEQNMGSYNQQSQQLQREMHALKMQQAFSDPEIARFEREYDKRVGAGEFRKEVNAVGSLAYHNGEYLEPQVTVRRAYERMQKLFGPLETTPPAEAQPKVESRATKPLPNMGSGKTGSPVPRKPRTTDDLRKIAASLGG